MMHSRILKSSSPCQVLDCEQLLQRANSIRRDSRNLPGMPCSKAQACHNGGGMDMVGMLLFLFVDCTICTSAYSNASLF